MNAGKLTLFEGRKYSNLTTFPHNEAAGEHNNRRALRRWLSLVSSPRLLEIGCGAAEDAGEWLAGGVAEYVGVDLDETAIARARARWPRMTFLCTDAARLPATAAGRFHAVLIRRPDLFVRPGNWQQVFAALPALLLSQGRVLMTLLGAAETAVARRWLEENGLRVVAEERWPGPDVSYLLIAVRTFPEASQPAGGCERFSEGTDDGKR